MARTTTSASAEKKGTRAPRLPTATPRETEDEGEGYSRTPRSSRASSARENAADPKMRPVVSSQAPLNLPYVKARPGYVQRYGRISLQGQDDVENISRLEAKGWSPRKSDTLPSGSKAPVIRKGEYTGYVGIRGNILMERPVELNEQYRQANRDATEAQIDHVRRQLFAEHRPGVKALGRPKMEVESSVGVRGRKRAPKVLQQDDDDGGDTADE